MTGNPRRWLPVAVVLTAVAAMGVAARRTGGLDAGLAAGVWKQGRPVVTVLAVVALAVVATRYARHRDDGYGVLHRAGVATAALLTAAAVLTPIGLLFFGRSPSTRHATASNGLGGTMSPPPGMTMKDGKPGKPHHGVSIADIIVIVVLGMVLAAAVGMLLYSLIRLLARIRIRRQPVERIEFTPLDAEIEQLAEAVAAGAEALEYEGDAREAVIACYSAMEVAVSAGGGGSRRATDTPEEFLRRVTAARLIPEEPASRLTELFREARFSGHPIAEEQRDAAREALRIISEHLQARVAEAQARVTAAAGGRT